MKLSQKTKISTPKLAEVQAWYQRLIDSVWPRNGMRMARVHPV
jgi:hypothetical protein